MISSRISLLALTLFLASSCSPGTKGDPSHVDNSAPGDLTKSTAKPKTLQADYGVHLENKTVFMGALNDESGGPGSAGTDFANGKRVLARWIASGTSKLLPEGWKLELVERDHSGDAAKAAKAYNEIKDQVLCFATAYGDASTSTLLRMLKEDDVLIFPALFTSTMSLNEYTPPAGPSYRDQALRALDWTKESAGSSEVILGALYGADSYGKDALAGWDQGAEALQLGISLNKEISVASTPNAILELKDKGATHVLLATLPPITSDVLKAAKKSGYSPIWLGLSESWNKSMSGPNGLSKDILAGYRRVSGAPYLGEKLEGMDRFLAAWKKYGVDLGEPSDESLRSFIQGVLAVDALANALDQNDATRSGYRHALSKVAPFDALGMVAPMDFSEIPFRASDKTRVLAPTSGEERWKVVGALQSPILTAEPERAASPLEKETDEAVKDSQPDGAAPAPLGAASAPSGGDGVVPPAPDSATASEVK
jgi:ABC-type branched-subunit amino acid transport system substrate-binding protein